MLNFHHPLLWIRQQSALLALAAGVATLTGGLPAVAADSADSSKQPVEIVPASKFQPARGLNSDLSSSAGILIVAAPRALSGLAAPSGPSDLPRPADKNGPPILIVPARSLLPAIRQADSETAPGGSPTSGASASNGTLPTTGSVLIERAQHSASVEALTAWEQTLKAGNRQIVLASGVSPGVPESAGKDDAPVANRDAELVEPGAAGDLPETGSLSKPLDPAALAQLYAEIYSVIPFNRSEYDANPRYRHDATMELLLGQLRPTVVAPPASGSDQGRVRQPSPYNPPFFYNATDTPPYLNIPWYYWWGYQRVGR